jgi:DNA modification methylase
MSTIEMIRLDQLRPLPRNARIHSRKQIRQIAESISRFGFTNPILIDDENNIVAGHGRAAAAKELGMTSVRCLRIGRMSATEKRAYILTDNKLALNAGWDEELLGLELKDLMVADLDFNLDITGFSIAEIDHLIEGLAPEEQGDPADERLPKLGAAAARSKLGDLWRLGPHRLICGNALDPSVVARLMGEDKAEMVFTDPPYNVAIDGNVGGLGKVRHREFAMASGEMTSAEFEAFLGSAFANLVAHSIDGSIHFICMDWRHMGEMLGAGKKHFTELKNLIAWVKDNGGMGTFYRSRHELVFAFKNGSAPHLNSFELGQHGRYRTNVWEYRGANSRKAGRLDELALHPTVKPVAMIADAIKDVSRRGGIVLDLFGGSGSTLVAAHKTGRRARLCELDPFIAIESSSAGKHSPKMTPSGSGRQQRPNERSRRISHDPVNGGRSREADSSQKSDRIQNHRRALRRVGIEDPIMNKNHKINLEPPSPDSEPYDVGYRKPPAGNQFKPGQSGNPKGRPKGARNKLPAIDEECLKTIIFIEAYRTVRITEGKRQKSIPMAQAIVRSVAVNAARGLHRSQRLFAEMLSETERSYRHSYDEYARTMIEYKVDWEEELERRKRAGEKGREPLPHPDDIVIDNKTGRVTIKGPCNKREKARWDELYARVEECDRAILELTVDMKKSKDEGMRKFLETEIGYEQNIRNIIVGKIGERPKRPE